MKGMKKTLLVAFSLFAAVTISACGGGGGGSSTPATNAVVSKGIIEKFGSIFVNGVEFKTVGATLHLRDDAAKPDRVLQTESEVEVQSLLAKGMVVTVKGTVDSSGTTGVAQEIEFRDTLKAKIDDIGTDFITVLGQKIILDDSVKPLLASLAVGNVVEISGLPDDKGQIRATHLKKRDDISAEFEVKGFVKLITGSNNSFTLLLSPGATSGITVNLAAGVALPVDGSFIEVKTATTAGGVITAVKLEVEDELHAAENQKVSIEGFVASGTADDFVVNGQRVQTNAQTVFLDGVKANIAIGRKLEAEGPIVGGILTATKIAFKVVNSKLSTGVIEKFGSIMVNGVEFKTLGAKLHLRDSKTDKVLESEIEIQTHLKPGMIVTVKGGIDDNGQTGIAQEIEFRDVLEGKIDSIDTIAKTMTVMGQTVRIEDNVTRLNDDDTLKVFAAAGFAVGNFVEVSAFPDDTGGLRATRVAKKDQGELEVKGFVTSIGTGSFGLSLTPGGTATVTVTGSLPAGAIVGSFIEVKANAAPANGAVTATTVQLEDRLAGGEKVEVEGIVTSGTVDSFTINGQKVVTNASTLFEGGLKADFAAGVKVEAEGPLDANGAIAAVKVAFRSNIKIEADASAVTASGLTVLGKTVAINAFTRIDNGPLANGQHVEVRAYLDRDGNLVASRVVVKNADVRAFLQGPVSAKDGAAGTMTILSVPITTTGAQFRISVDAADAPVLKDAFFAQVKANVTVVKVRWASSNTALAVEQAEIQLGK